MKKVLLGVCLALAGFAACAQEKAAGEETRAPQVARPQAEKASWPVWVAFNNTKDIDVVGLRLTIPYGSCESVTGFDLGFFGRCRYFEGFQLNLLRNDVADVMAGFQIGLYNSAGRGDMMGLQIGLWNEAHALRGIQVGLINIADSATGIQVGLINRAEAMYGFQAGGVNVIRESELPFMPLLNVGFDHITEL